MINIKDYSVFEVKKDIMLREYDSIFYVYSRQTDILFSFRKWNITFLLAFAGLLISQKVEISKSLSYFIIISTNLIFMIMEIGERVFMLYLINELKVIEKIFMEREINDMVRKILEFEFRGLRHHKTKIKNKIRTVFTVFTLSQFISWYFIIFLFTITLMEFLYSIL